MSAPNLLSLKWGNHKWALTCKLNNLRHEEVFCDATIVCAAKYFPVHKIVLSNCSEYFEEIFKKAPCRHPFIILKDTDVTSAEYILDFMYEGDVRIPEDKLAAFLKTAENLRVKGLAVPDVPTSEQNNDASCDTESENNDELNTSVSTEANELTSHQYVTPNEVRSDSGKDVRILKKSPQSHVNTGDQILNKRGCLRPRKNCKVVTDHSPLSPDTKPSNENLHLSCKRSPTKTNLPLNSSPSEKGNENSKNSTSTNENNKEGKRNLLGKMDNQPLGQESSLNLRECTFTFTGKQEVVEEDISDREWTSSRIKGSLPQQSASSHKIPRENILSEAQMKVDVDEFFDDPSDGSRLKFTDDIVPLQYQIPDVHLGSCIDSSLSGIEESSMSDDDTDEVPSADDLTMYQVSGDKDESTRGTNGQNNDEGSTSGLSGSQVGPLSAKTSPAELEKPFACYICPYRTKYRSALTKHVIVHTGAKPLKCTYCLYETARTAHLKVHMMTHMREKPYKCELCPKTFAQKSNYKVHKWVHSQCKPYRCHMCAYSSNNSSSLRRHIRIHEGMIPFKCHLCTFGAQSSSDLKKHFRTHTGEKPFPCPHCDYKAAVKTTLKRHIAARHKIS